jgi:BNR repeat-like domain
VIDPRTGRLYLFMVWVHDGLVRPGDPGLMLLSRSGDGGGAHWSNPRRFESGNTALQRAGVVVRSSPQVPSFAVDGRGVLYGVWQDSRFSHGRRDEVLFVTSRDGGTHWSRPRRISMPAGEALLPTVAAQGSDRVAVLYLRVAEDASLQARYRLALSRDGGGHFSDTAVSKPFAITNAPNLTASTLIPGGHFVGDYMGLVGLGVRGFGAVFVSVNRSPRNPTDVFYVQRS